MLGALSASSLTLGPSAAPAPFTAECSNAGAAKALVFPSSSNNRARLLIKSSFSSTSRTTPSFRTAVAAVDSDQLSPEKQQQANKYYYFVVANAKFMLDEEEHFQEQLFERHRLFKERNIENDFWLVIEPKFLENFPDNTLPRGCAGPLLLWFQLMALGLQQPYATLGLFLGDGKPRMEQVQRYPKFMFMKLRLDRVLSDTYEADDLEEALASNPTTIEFEKPEAWVAPYPKYKYGWWESLPTGVKV